MIGLALYVCGGVGMFGYAMHETIVPMSRAWVGHTLPHYSLPVSVGMWALAAGGLTLLSAGAAVAWPIALAVFAHDARAARRARRVDGYGR